MIKELLQNIINLSSWRTKRKIVVFESDDWGSQRMPSNGIREVLCSKGVLPFPSKFDLFDSLEQNEDLHLLFDTLTGFKDINGNFPVFTALCNVANPDFSKIIDSDYKSYYYLSLADQIINDVNRHEVLRLWNQGHQDRIFTPEFHGREHLNVMAWLRAINIANSKSKSAFDCGYTSLNPKIFKESNIEFQAAFDFEFKEDLTFQEQSIVDGLNVFEELNNRRARYFAPTNGPFHPKLDLSLSKGGIDFVMRAKWHKVPKGNSRYSHTLNFLGKISKDGLICIPRNNSFEPSSNKYSVRDCLRKIDDSFRLRLPSIISTHRVNYIGSLCRDNRTNGILNLNELIRQIQSLYPDVEFLSSVELGDIIKKGVNSGHY
jgi:hypothetical protein